MKKKEAPKTSTQENKSPKPTTKKSFLVVGLGASAGGVKALQTFFGTIPPNSGMAFAVVLHLSPEHESNLAQIIQNHTSMPVIQVNETHEVEPNHVYVIPPNRQLELSDGVIRCTDSVERHGARIAIDVFFRTLAEAYQRNAVCVILSGTGTDGTLGLKRVKESNGFAIVQDPDDAEHSDMPLSAIETNLVDWILPVHRIPQSLIHFRDSSERLHLTSDDDGKVAKEINADESLREILTLLRVRTGHDFSNYKTPTLIRRIARHLQIHSLEDIPSYLVYLRENPNEIQSLLKNLLINVTNFFRDKDAFGALEHDILPQLFEGKKSKDTVRVWSCGCASGEEAFSIAMLLTEYADRLSDPPKIQVFGTDVDDEAIAEAREHRYPESIEADVSPHRLKRFFIREGNYYRIRKELRELILFAPHNVLRDPPFSRLDLITCRNLLIYLNRETQERLMEIFHFSLVTDGFLFLGSSETADGVPILYTPIDKKHRIYTRRHAPLGQILPPQMPLAGKWEARPTLKKQKFARSIGEQDFSLSEVHYKLLESLAPPSVLVNSDFEIQYMSESAGRYLQFKGGEPSNNLLKLVNHDLLPDLRAALFSVQREQKTSRFENIRVRIDGDEALVTVTVRAAEMASETTDYLLVTFEEGVSPYVAPADRENGDGGRVFEKNDQMESFVRRLEEDLRRTKSQLRSTIEQHEVSIEELKAANEELQAINEELRSATEELETSKEELQSVNEELTTVNHELKDKIDEATRTYSDLQNLMASTEIATIFLDRNLRIKRYTPPILDIFNVTPPDVGRPLEHFTNNLEYDGLTEDAEKVLRTLTTIEHEVRNRQNRTFLARILPYRTAEDRIEGVVINFLDITRRKQAEHALHQSEERMRMILESAKDYAIFTFDLDRRVSVWNAGAEAMFGYSEAEIVGKPGDILFVPEDRKRGVPEHEAETALTKGRATNERWHIRRDATRFYGSGLTTPLLDRDGSIIGYVKIMRDLTEQKKLEDAKFFLAAIVESSEDAVITVDLENDITSWNAAAEKLYGYTAKEALGKSLTMLALPEDFTEVFAKAESVKSSQKVEIYETVRVRKDGTKMHVEVVLSPVKNENGRVVGISTIARDITARKASSDALRGSEERYRAVVESATDYAIFTLDENNKISSWSKGAENIFGWKESEIIGSDGAILFTPEDRQKGEYKKELQTALRAGRAEDERWHIRKDSTLFFASGLLMRLDDGETGFVKICRDQTERVKAETVQREKDMLAQFVTTQEDERRRIARDIHDHIGQQLTVLRLKLESVKEMCDDEKICDEIEIVNEITKRLDREVDFLAWELRPAALDDLGLRVSLENFVVEWSRHTEIKADFHATGLVRKRLAFETETNLYRIAQEALNNIYKHAKPEGVSVLLEKRGDSVTLIVEDDGIGFNPKDKRNRSKGIGLIGMTERAKICGGTLEIESKKGKGTTIFARVPAKME
ncbi:MAG TPA: PAS domain S-box protein [Pyrinomonadaceae bacterium]|jgi:two-component system CheB/CheR fusion protein